MAEPAKKPVQQPESYQPRKPEILAMAEAAQDNTIHQPEAQPVNELAFRIEKKESFQIMGLSGYETEDTERNSEVTGLWVDFIANYDKKLRKHYTAPYGQVGACNEKYVDGKMKMIIGAEYKGKMIKGMSLETIPAATWAVFSFPYPSGYSKCMEAAAKINEWFPASGYTLNEEEYRLEVYLGERWEIWMPILSEGETS